MATDYHAEVREAVLGVMKAAIPSLDWHAVEDIEDAAHLTQPCGAVACVGPEQDRPDFATNAQDGTGYPVAVVLLGTGTARGEKRLGDPTTLTGFRRAVHVAFHLKRLAAVPRVGYCEVSDSGPIVDDKSPLFQKLQTALVVTAVGRFPRD